MSTVTEMLTRSHLQTLSVTGHHFRYEQDGLGVVLSGIAFIESAP